MAEIRKTPLYDAHVKAGGRMVEFAGYLMPVQYVGVIAEHNAVRTVAGLFDVSHMGEVEVTGPDAQAAIQRIVTNSVVTLPPGKALYTVMCHPHGGIVDDLIIYRLARERFIIVTNASNADKDFAWIRDHMTGNAKAVNRGDEYALIALQGPKAQAFLAPLTNADLDPRILRRFGIAAPGLGYDAVHVAGRPALIARTGYTGEDGFELFLAPDDAPAVWDALVAAGAVPTGLGCRDSLRLEMGYMLYGNDISDSVNPIEAGLAWVVKPQAGEFIGKGPILEMINHGAPRTLVGLVLQERGVPRHGYDVTLDGRKIGVVTSGIHSPTLNQGIAMALVETAAAKADAMEIQIRGKGYGARVTPPPFCRRPAAKA